MGRKLCRSKTNKVISGVCGGIAEYFAVDPTIVRIISVVLGLTTQGVLIVAYIIAIFIVPQGEYDSCASGFERKPEAQEEEMDNFTGEWKDKPKFDSGRSGILVGALLVLVGVMFFARQFFSWLDVKYFLPMILIIIGGLIIFRGRRG